MGCTPKCTHKKPSRPTAPQRSSLPNGITVASASELALRRDREAMCQTCPFAASCPIGADTPEARLARAQPAETCWAGRWPDARGRVRTGAFTTIGVPKIVRVRIGLAAAWRVFRRHLETDGQFRDCGCFAGLVDARAAMGRAARRLRVGWRRWSRRSVLW